MLSSRFRHLFFGLTLTLTAGAFNGCGGTDAGDDSDTSNVVAATGYEVDFGRFNGFWNGAHYSKIEDAFTAQVLIGDKVIPAPTHLFGTKVNVIPYSDLDGQKSAGGELFARGDREISKYYKAGEVGIAVKHHRPEHNTVDLNGDGGPDMKENFKLQDTHIEVVVGVERDGQAGVITMNNPQAYESGAFGTQDYPMIFLKAVYPDYITSDLKHSFEDNVRTMLLGFNAVTNFPGDYNGGDPLGARNPERVREHVKNMILAITGDAAALAYFKDPANKVYCAELAHLSFSAGVIVPLNDAGVASIGVPADAWKNFQDFVTAHNNGKSTPFTAMNENERVKYVKGAIAPKTLKPMAAYGGDANALAFQPMTMADIVEQFMRTHIPREIVGEELAPAQAGVLKAMRPGLLEQMGFDRPEADPAAKAAVNALYDELIKVVGKSYGSYAEFRQNLEPIMKQARSITGPRGDSGEGLFTPPSLFHVIAQGKMPGGLMGMQYVGHGIHVSAVKKSGEAAPTPTPVDDIADRVSCKARGNADVANSCGGQAPGGCWCDAQCTETGDCCADAATICAN